MDLDRFIETLGRARPRGAAVAEWSLCASERRSLSLGIKDREACNAHTPLTLSEGGGVRYLIVWSDGLVSRGALERRQVEREVEPALEQARAAAYDDPDAAQVLGPAEFPEVRSHTPGVAAVARGEAGMLAGRLDSVRRRIDEGGFRTWSGSFSAGEGEVRVVTSAGLDVANRGTSAGWYVTINGEIGDGYSARAFESDADYELRLDRLAALVAELKRPAEPMTGGLHPVILHPHVVEQYVVGTLLHNLDGSTVSHEEGHFRRDEFGTGKPPVLREDLGLRIDPLEPLKSGTYRFTAEGLPAVACTFVERGRLVQPVCSLKYARRLGVPPTPAPASMDTLYFEGPRPLPLAEALPQAAGGALVLSVLGVHTQDTASGDFSLSAPQALRLGPEGYEGKLRCTISGNLFRVLQDADLRFVAFDGEHTPGLLFRCRLDPK